MTAEEYLDMDKDSDNTFRYGYGEFEDIESVFPLPFEFS
jgi:hypothetical protein